MQPTNNEKIRPCQACKRPTRPNGWSPEEYPGTVTYGGHGHCTSCRRAQIDAEKDKAELDRTGVRPTVEQNKASLLAYFAARRPYRIELGQTNFPDPLLTHPAPKCGTPAGYKNHVKRKEKICDQCKESYSEHRPTRRARALKPCGTYAAWARHKRRGEDIDLACEEAYLLHRSEQNARLRERRAAA